MAKNIQTLTPEQLKKVIERQKWLESWQSEPDLEYESYYLGGKSEFYRVHLWEDLGLGDYATKSEDLTAIGFKSDLIEGCKDIFGETTKEDGGNKDEQTTL